MRTGILLGICISILLSQVLLADEQTDGEAPEYFLGGGPRPVTLLPSRAEYFFPAPAGSDVGSFRLLVSINQETERFTEFCLEYEGGCLEFPERLFSEISRPQIGQFRIRIEREHAQSDDGLALGETVGWLATIYVEFGDWSYVEDEMQFPVVFLTFDDTRLVRAEIHHDDFNRADYRFYEYEETGRGEAEDLD